MSGSSAGGDVKNLAAMYTWSSPATAAGTTSTVGGASLAADSDSSFPHFPKERVLHKDGYAQRAAFLDEAKPSVVSLVAVLQKHLPLGNVSPAELQVLHALERWLGRIVVESSLKDVDPPTP